MVSLHKRVYYAFHVATRQAGIRMPLAMGVAMAESGMNPFAVGDGGDSVGLMQVNYRYHPNPFGPSVLLAPEVNVAVGVRFLADMIEATGSEEDGVSAYNQGLTGWRNHGRQANKAYVDLVMRWTEYFESQGVQMLDDQTAWIAGDEEGPWPY